MQYQQKQQEQQLHFLEELVVIGNLQFGQYVETGFEPNCLGWNIGTNPWISLFAIKGITGATGIRFDCGIVWLIVVWLFGIWGRLFN